MSHKTAQKLIEEFYVQLDLEYKSKYSFHQVRNCVFFPWKKASQSIFKGELITIRMKYFGSFQLFINRIKYLLNKQLAKKEKDLEKIEKYEKFIREHKE